MSQMDQRTLEELSAILHQPSAAFFDLPHDVGHVDAESWARIRISGPETPLMRIVRERAAARQDPWPWPTSESVAKPEPVSMPGFDSEAHRAFMRGLG